ncbi:DUF4349 domain-containing protein [Solihabitans fulvus]|uniref:DUF4349 domain-containing protein n=1 Tax=Solihabitans fulvus TaxID=1892852 RepID=A0A5B2XPJ5_9PSEU|nr:DUF4349 domain-containing protein [Solihabitans fulvus]KAA2264874.1 DUF4349 domain-containing protein [Solihabitans fulvus]
MTSRGIAGAIGSLLLVGVLAGCANSADSGSSTAAQRAVAPAPAPAQGQPNGQPQNNAGMAKSDAAGQGANAAQATQPVVAVNRQIVRSAQVDLRDQNVSGTLAKAIDVARNAGGQEAEENSDQEHATVTLRVPAEKLDAVLDGLGKVATVTHRQQKSEDVTEQSVDIESRLKTQQASVDRLRGLYERAGSVTEIAQVENELTRRQADLESLQHRRDALAGQVALSTVVVSISRPDGAPPADSAQSVGFLGALAGGWHALLTALRVLVVAFGAALPFLVVLGVPVAAVLFLRRRRRGLVPAFADGPAPELAEEPMPEE